MPRAAVFAVLLIVLPCGLARAQTDYRPRSEATAATLSALGTLVPVGIGLLWWKVDQPNFRGTGGYTYYKPPNRVGPAVLIAGGILLGPSLGHFYAGRMGGVLLRAGLSVATPLLAGMILAAGAQNDGGWFPSFDPGAVVLAGGIMAAGAVTIAGSVVHDLATASQAARQRNGERADGRLRVTPTYVPAARAVGFSVRASF